MKSSWAWMMVLVALGSGLIRAKPQIDVQKVRTRERTERPGTLIPGSFGHLRQEKLGSNEHFIHQLKGTWYPLATAWITYLSKKTAEIKIQANDNQSFDVFFPVFGNGKCKEVKSTYIAKKGGGFQIKGGSYQAQFVDTDYENYLIMNLGFDDTPELHLYGRKKVLTEEMKRKFQSQVSKMGYRQRNTNFLPRIASCPK